MANFTEIDQEIIPGTINGCNYAPKVRVLARTQEKLLIWVPGSTYWSGMNGNSYCGASMRVVNRHTHGAQDLKNGLICDDKRLKQSIFADCAEKIDAHMGEGFHKLLGTRKTVVVGDNTPFSIYGEMPVTGHEFGYKEMMARRAKHDELKAKGVTGLSLAMLLDDYNKLTD
jgi:hypothetical protein